MIQIDIEIPKNCAECPCFNAEQIFCQITDIEYNGEKRPNWCPLIEVGKAVEE